MFGLGTPPCRQCSQPMVTLGSCSTCNATGLIAGGAMFCVDCGGHGARFACHNPECTTAAPAPPAPAAPVERRAAEPPRPVVQSRPEHNGHRFRNGRCEHCGELEMLARSQGWACKQPFFVW
jgi:hypothetical protein